MYLSCYVKDNRLFLIENAGNPDPNTTPKVLKLDSLSERKVRSFATSVGLKLHDELSLDEMKELLLYRLLDEGYIRN